MAVGKHFHRLHRGPPVQVDALARLERAARLAEREPGPILEWANQQDLRGRARRARADEPRVPDPTGIEHEQIARRDQAEKIAEDQVLEARGAADEPAGASHGQEPAGAPLFDRRLGDQLGREFVVEVGKGESLIWRQNNAAWLEGGLMPKRRYASGVAQRPRGVRSRNPCWIRNGS